MNEALDVLALKQGATSAEIKIAYRDMVKVWHPDRFGSDARLREKAEEKLKQLNEAYCVLQADSKTAVAEAGRASSSGGSSMSTAESDRARAIRKAVRVRRILRCVAVALVFGVGYVVVAHKPMDGAIVSPDSVQRVGDSGAGAAAEIPVAPTLGGASAGKDVLPKDSGRSSQSEVAQFGVGSEAETAQLDSVCSRFKASQDSATYRSCLKAQLDMITNAPGQPDLSGLNGVEWESMESACSEARRLHGVDGYDRCLTVQVAELAAEPVRPDLSGLSDKDRSSVEAACRGARDREGPAVYYRCLGRFVKALAEARQGGL